MQRPGILLPDGVGDLPISRLAAKVKAAGFEDVALACTAETNVAAAATALHHAGLSFAAAVAECDMGAVWCAGDEGDAVIAELANLAEAAGRAGASLLILPAAGHAAVSQYGIDRYRRLGAFAAERGVALALSTPENARLLEVLLAILDPPHGTAVAPPATEVSRAVAVVCREGLSPEELAGLPELPFFACADLSGDVTTALAALYEEERRCFRRAREC